MIMEEENDCMEEESLRDISDSDSAISDSSNEFMWEDQNGIKKRKRKSTIQIKMLKQELDGQMNWTK